ncbi:cystatin-B-like [Anneissia japonica]|uniref:cystatin-B-like n=1 Tax=Anneissia japonica TaxID=1529436 RepID=UPI001425A6B4|nr:cystatin-B-like [Anneissia japonica]
MAEPQMQATSRPMLGAVSDPAPANAEIQAMIEKVKDSVEKKVDRKLPVYKATQFCSQTVNGYKFFVKVDVGDNKFIHLELYKAISGELTLNSVEDNKTETDTLKK